MDLNKSNLSKDVVIGSHEFSEVLKSSAFVDKTHLIRDVIDSNETVILVTASRRFGKTTNIQMLKTFLEIHTDEDGKIIQKESTYSYNMFSSNSLLIETAIDKHGKNMIETHLASYPVIYLSLKDTDCSSFEEFSTFVA